MIRALLAAATVALLAGCAASVVKGSEASMRVPPASASALVLNVTGSKDSLASSDWEDFKREWQENFAAQAALAHVAFSMQDGPATPTGQDGTLLSVFVNDYRFIRPGTRYVTGVVRRQRVHRIDASATPSLKTGDDLRRAHRQHHVDRLAGRVLGDDQQAGRGDRRRRHASSCARARRPAPRARLRPAMAASAP